MAVGEIVSVTVGIIAIVTTAIGIGSWIGLRRAESKRIVKAEHSISEIKREMSEFKEKLLGELKNHIVDADHRYARKDLIEAHLEFIKDRQKEITDDVKEIKKALKDGKS